MSLLRALRKLGSDRVLRHILLVSLVAYSTSLLIGAVPFWMRPEIEGMDVARSAVAIASASISVFFLSPLCNLAIGVLTKMVLPLPFEVRILWSLSVGLLYCPALFGALAEA